MAYRRPSGNTITPPFPNVYSQNQQLQPLHQQQPTPLSGHPPAQQVKPLSTSSAFNTTTTPTSTTKSMTDAASAAATTASPTLRNKRARPSDMHAPETPTTANAGQQPPAEDGFIADQDAADSAAEDDEEEGAGKPNDKKAGRRKIKIEFIQDKSRRHITFSKRKAGIMKKAYELSTLTGTQVLLLVVSETGLVYTFTTAKLQPLVTQPEGKNLIQACLNAPQGQHPSAMPVGTPLGRQSNPPSSIPPAAPGGAQPIPGQPPQLTNQSGNRNVVGGLAIGGGSRDDEDDRAHDDVDGEGDRRGAPRRRGSNTGTGRTGTTRSPTSPHTPQLSIPTSGGAGGQQSPAGAGQMGMGAGGQPYSPSSATPQGADGQGAPPPSGAQPGMYHPQHHPQHQHMMAPTYYPQAPGMAGGHWPPPGTAAQGYARR